jgi:hypothetical protein
MKSSTGKIKEGTVSVRAHSDRGGAALSVHVVRATTKKSKNDVSTQERP